jgi:hypothetical protein
MSKIYETTGATTTSYTSLFSPNTTIWHQQRAPIYSGTIKPNYNYPDFILGNRLKLASEQTRRGAESFKERQHETYRQLKFNNSISGSGGPYPTSREDWMENYNYSFLSNDVKTTNVIKGVIVVGVLYYLFFK